MPARRTVQYSFSYEPTEIQKVDEKPEVQGGWTWCAIGPSIAAVAGDVIGASRIHLALHVKGFARSLPLNHSSNPLHTACQYSSKNIVWYGYLASISVVQIILHAHMCFTKHRVMVHEH